MPKRYLHDLFLKSPSDGDPTVSSGEVSVLPQCLTFLTITIFFLMFNPNPSCYDSKLLFLVLSTLGLSYRLFTFSYISLSCYHFSLILLYLYIQYPHSSIRGLVFCSFSFSSDVCSPNSSHSFLRTVVKSRQYVTGSVTGCQQNSDHSYVLSSLRKRYFILFNPLCICSSGCKGLVSNSSWIFHTLFRQLRMAF